MKQPKQHTVVIVGGGAAGLAAAVSLGQAASWAKGSYPSVRIIVLEAHRRIGSSILRSGNGRCNFSHLGLSSDAYYNASFVEEVFSALHETPDNSQVRAWWRSLGLEYIESPTQKNLLYPLSNKASSVLEVLRLALDEYEVQVYTETKVREIKSPQSKDDSFHVTTDDDNEVYMADSVVIACGGGSNIVLQPELPYRFCTPVLGPLRTETRFLSALDGIRVRARVMLKHKDFSEVGEVLFRSYGVSGIAIFNTSRFACSGDILVLDLMPETSLEKLKELLATRAEAFSNRTWEMFLAGLFVPQLARMVLKQAKLNPKNLITKNNQAEELSHLADSIKNFELVVQGVATDQACQVQRGGFATEAIDPSTMQVRGVSGLYIVGEALDVDGPCGGYNLHWAWASGLLAGRSAAAYCNRQ